MSTAPTPTGVNRPGENATVEKALNHLGFSCKEPEVREASEGERHLSSRHHWPVRFGLGFKRSHLYPGYAKRSTEM
jgi:hypothetical protein